MASSVGGGAGSADYLLNGPGNNADGNRRQVRKDWKIEEFYKKLGVYDYNWIQMRADSGKVLNYKQTHIGRFNFEQVGDVPDFTQCRVAISRNGGPIAFMFN